MPIKIRHQEVNLVTNIRFRYKANFDGLVFTTKFGSENCKIIWQKVNIAKMHFIIMKNHSNFAVKLETYDYIYPS